MNMGNEICHTNDVKTVDTKVSTHGLTRVYIHDCIQGTYFDK